MYNFENIPFIFWHLETNLPISFRFIISDLLNNSELLALWGEPDNAIVVTCVCFSA